MLMLIYLTVFFQINILDNINIAATNYKPF